MISIQELSVFFGDRVLYDNIGFMVNPNDRIGLTGRNGAGKSTLMKIIAGLQSPTTGGVYKSKEIRVGYLPQEMEHAEESTVLNEILTGQKEVKGLQDRLKVVEHEVTTREDYESEAYSDLLVELNEIHERLRILGGDTLQEEAERILLGLGFLRTDFDRKMKEFSGGWKMRVELGKLLLQKPECLLLDEPTNHLDIESIIWLEEFLVDFPGAVILISHDKRFLDAITKRTIEISNGKVYDYPYSWSKYVEHRRMEIERQAAEQKNQEKYIEKTQQLIDKYRAKANKASFAQNLIKKLDKLEEIEIDDFEATRLSVKFPPAPHSGKIIVEAKSLEKTYSTTPVFKDIDFVIPRGDKIALIGKNGAGKSTLVRILNEVEAHGGELIHGHQVKVGWFAQDEAERLDRQKTVYETIDDVAQGEIRKQIRGILGAFLFRGDDIDKKVAVLSGGEKTRLALCKLLLSPANFLVLDEPTNHLDMTSKEVLKEALKQYDGTLLVVSHDREFLSGLTQKVYELKDGKLAIHHMDIDEYLKWRKSHSIAQLEHVSKKTEKKDEVSAENRFQQDKEKKRVQNRIKKIEEEIAENEKVLSEMEVQLAGLDYSDTRKVEEFTSRYELKKKELEGLYKEWDNLLAEA